MPEGPEVWNTACWLYAWVGKRATGIERWSKIEDDADSHLGVLKDVDCFGKRLLLRFKRQTLVIGLGMTGMLFEGNSELSTKHRRGALVFEDGSELVYCDPRQIGNTAFFTSKFETVGIDLLRTTIDDDQLWSLLQKHSRKVVAMLLMEQSVFPTIGNYLKSEILYAARLSPYIKCGDITEKQCHRLRRALHNIPRKSARMGGFTLESFRLPTGIQGGYRSLIYKGKGETDKLCPREHYIQACVQGGRRTYYCELCQHVTEYEL